jgi:hypothetical protein
MISLKCPKCGYENSPLTFKCYECGKMFKTNEELEATFPPGRSGSAWNRYYLTGEKEPRDPLPEYAAKIGTEYKPDPTLSSRDEAWIAPNGDFWGCGYEEHELLATCLVAKLDLKGKPEVSECEGLGGSVSTDEQGRKYYQAYARYPDSAEILKEHGWLALSHPAFQWGEHAIYGDRDEVTPAQRVTVETWRKKYKIGYIHYYDPWDMKPKEN